MSDGVPAQRRVCMCPRCLNWMWVVETFRVDPDVEFVICGRCLTAGCDHRTSQHGPPDCTMAKCDDRTHQHGKAA